MRSFDIYFWILLFTFYVVITLFSNWQIRRLLTKSGKKRFTIFFLALSTLVLFMMIFLYLWPGDVRSSTDYTLYFYFNAFLITDFIFKIPLALLCLPGIIIQKGRKRKVVSWLGLIVSAALGIIVLQGVIIGRNKVIINHLELEFNNLPHSFQDYKVVHISDTHVGSFTSNRLMVKTSRIVNELQPDLLFFTGDLVNNFAGELNGWEAVFKNLSNKFASYSILGNHDYGNYSRWENEEAKEENFNKILRAHEAFGFELLRNENVRIYSGNDSIFLIGVENWGHAPFPQYADLEKAMNGVDKNSFEILLTHDPAHWESLIEGKKDIELTLSGHTHGMQMGIKPAGILMSPAYWVRKYWGGLYGTVNSYLYVNVGLGTIGIPFRIDNPAEITLITLKRRKID